MSTVNCTRQAEEEPSDSASAQNEVEQVTGKQINKTFTFCLEGSPSRFNPQVELDGTTLTVTGAIYDTLVTIAYDTIKIIPSLAESWQVSPNGLEYTFNLRKGVKFHTTPYFTPTRDFNSDDVVFSFDRPKNPQNPYHEVGGGVYEYFTSMDMQNLVKDVEKINDHTVQVHTVQAQCSFSCQFDDGLC